MYHCDEAGYGDGIEDWHEEGSWDDSLKDNEYHEFVVHGEQGGEEAGHDGGPVDYSDAVYDDGGDNAGFHEYFDELDSGTVKCILQ